MYEDKRNPGFDGRKSIRVCTAIMDIIRFHWLSLWWKATGIHWIPGTLFWTGTISHSRRWNGPFSLLPMFPENNGKHQKKIARFSKRKSYISVPTALQTLRRWLAHVLTELQHFLPLCDSFIHTFQAYSMVPFDQPEAALDMFSRWISNTPLSLQ
ncbi:hypothetical protein B0H14DRAFT_2591967 [Mycena olivaceomarginata]|nr:hypothetical protein B0H14DRAFT_2591967 [Mycena olivaceomarginata]